MPRPSIIRRRDDGFPVTVARHRIQRPVETHGHVGTELVFVHAGSAIHRVNHEDFAARSGDVFVIGPACHHGFHRPKDLVVYNLSYDPELIAGMAGDLAGLPGYQALFVIVARQRRRFTARLHLGPVDQTEFEKTLESLWAELRGKKPGFAAFVRADLMKAVALLSRRYREEPPSRRHSPSYPAAVAASLLGRNFREEISMESLARASGVSNRHLTRLFDESFGMSPIAYLVELRLAEAARQLRRDLSPITRIALDCGFSDSNYFSRMFRARYGMMPRAFRGPERPAGAQDSGASGDVSPARK